MQALLEPDEVQTDAERLAMADLDRHMHGCLARGRRPSHMDEDTLAGLMETHGMERDHIVDLYYRAYNAFAQPFSAHVATTLTSLADRTCDRALLDGALFRRHYPEQSYEEAVAEHGSAVLKSIVRESLLDCMQAAGVTLPADPSPGNLPPMETFSGWVDHLMDETGQAVTAGIQERLVERLLTDSSNLPLDLPASTRELVLRRMLNNYIKSDLPDAPATPYLESLLRPDYQRRVVSAVMDSMEPLIYAQGRELVLN